MMERSGAQVYNFLSASSAHARCAECMPLHWAQPDGFSEALELKEAMKVVFRMVEEEMRGRGEMVRW